MSKRKIYLLFLSVFFGAGAFGINTQTYLTITDISGMERLIDLSTLGKITFPETNVMLHFQNGTLEPIGISTVSKMTFNQLTGLVKQKKTEALSVYPNPASDYIILDNASEGIKTISIYSISGTLVLKTQVRSSSGQIDISRLPKGFYLLKADNQAFKFSKK